MLSALPTSACALGLRFHMRTALTALAVISFGLISFADEREQQIQRWQTDYDQKILPILKAKCFSCHEGDASDGELDLSRYADGMVAFEKIDVWDRVGKRVRLKEMPPEGSPQLNDPEKAVVHRWLDAKPESQDCAKLATDETTSWYRGVVMSRRLTRTEYLNTIRSLTGLKVGKQFSLPSDGAGGEGFDTNGDSLFTSPIHVEQFLAIAGDLVDRLLEPNVTSSLTGLKVLFPEQTAAERRQLLAMTRDRNSVENTGRSDDRSDFARGRARQAVTRFARLAFRRPVTTDEVSDLMKLFDRRWQRNQSFRNSLGDPLKAILVSPRFLFLVEPEAEEGGVQRLTQHQLATRLSLFLWSTGPNEWLLNLADARQLETNDQIAAVAREMMADAAARSLGENFGLQWLGLAGFHQTSIPDRDVFPEFTQAIANDFREEAIRTVARVFQEDRPLIELLTSDHVVVNQRLADFYGVPVSASTSWQAVPSGDSQRGGVLTLGATLLKTSYPRRTSPVLRGQWVLEHLLGSHVPPPPPNVPALDETTAMTAVSFRKQLEQHRANPECASCHNRMDPLGFGLENFDATGQFRTTDSGGPIDSSGKLPSGDTFRGAGELKQILLNRRAEFEQNLIRRLLGFALGRELNKFDKCVVEDCQKALQQNEGRASAVIQTIVTSYPFQHRFFKTETR